MPKKEKRSEYCGRRDCKHHVTCRDYRSQPNRTVFLHCSKYKSKLKKPKYT